MKPMATIHGRRYVKNDSQDRIDTMKTASHFLLGLGTLMLISYCVIGIQKGTDFVHEPFVMLAASLFLIVGGLIGRFILPRL